jgi:hypothetical protein
VNLLDENFPEDQRLILREWRIPFQQVGREFSRSGIKDPDIILLLHHQRRVTFVTLDKDFFEPSLCHPAYCVAFVDVRADDAAHFVRSFLRHARFDSEAKRMGVISRIHHDGIQFWQRNQAALQRVKWPPGK